MSDLNQNILPSLRTNHRRRHDCKNSPAKVQGKIWAHVLFQYFKVYIPILNILQRGPCFMSHPLRSGFSQNFTFSQFWWRPNALFQTWLTWSIIFNFYCGEMSRLAEVFSRFVGSFPLLQCFERRGGLTLAYSLGSLQNDEWGLLRRDLE